jgi:SNF2 family DNA or RNA helicase
MHIEYRKLYIIDKSDVRGIESEYELYNCTKTVYADDFIGSFFRYEIATYPYLESEGRTREQMQTEQQWITRRNLFASDIYQRSSVVITLQRESPSSSHYYLCYHISNRIIDNVVHSIREPKLFFFVDLICRQERKEIIQSSERWMSRLVQPAQNVFDTRSTPGLETFLLKDGITLFDYQQRDLDWMCDIEANVLTKQNSVSYEYSLATPVLDGKLVLFDDGLFPTKLFQSKNDLYTQTIQYFGGNLISEVGLGKTMVSLLHAFRSGASKRHLYNGFVEYISDCNYIFKRGSQRGEKCPNAVASDNRHFCPKHANSLFLDKRVITFKNLENFSVCDFYIHGLLQTNASLVVCPNQLCDQWVREYYDKFVDDKRVVMIATKDQFNTAILGDILFADIVVVSYQLLVSSWYGDLQRQHTQFGRAELGLPSNQLLRVRGKPLHSFRWNNVFFDESHEIMAMSSFKALKTSLGELIGTCKWNVTGTPFAHGVDGFLNLIGLNTTFVPPPGKIKQMSLDYIVRLGINESLIKVLQPLFRRNAKDSCIPILNTVTEHVHRLEFTSQERSIYNSYLEGRPNKYSNFLIQLCCDSELYEETKELVQNCKTLDEIQIVMVDYNRKLVGDLERSIHDLESEEASITARLSRLQVNDSGEEQLHEQLRGELSSNKRKKTIATKNMEGIQRTLAYLERAIENIKNEEETCPICMDVIDKESNLVVTQCGHRFCWACISQVQGNSSSFKCPSCNTVMSKTEVYKLKPGQQAVQTDSTSLELDKIIETVRSTKIGSIIHFLQRTGADNKTILFSQWDSLLHKVGKYLTEFGLNIVYCNGTIYQRKRAIHSFCNDKDVNIILLSSRNAASGVNLTVANTIILLEPVYGTREYRENIESQAIGRADRIGQQNPIGVHRFIIRDTIEQDILENNIEDGKIRSMQM